MIITLDTQKITNFISDKAKKVAEVTVDGVKAVKHTAIDITEAAKVKKLEAVASDVGLPSEIREEAKSMALKLKAAYEDRAKTR